jgi:hypothetical protein
MRFGIQAAPFGHNAQFRTNEEEHQFISNLYSVSEKNVLYLDAEYDQITPGSWIIVRRPSNGDYSDQWDILRQKVKDVGSVSIASYTLSGRVTRLILDGPWLPDFGDPVGIGKDLTYYPVIIETILQTTVYAQSEPLDLAQAPLERLVQGNQVELDGLFQGLEAGRWLIVTGERSEVPSATSGVRGSELVMLEEVFHGPHRVTDSYKKTIDLSGDTPHTTLKLANQGLAYTYKRDTVTIYGNVAKATHGETVREVLGSGAADQRRQTFTLKQAPLTFVAAPTAAGAISTLTVRVNDIEWAEADNLLTLGPEDRNYITQTTEDGQTRVIFGDGAHGTLLPTGRENITACYRYGLGQPGNVEPVQISMLARKPAGVAKVVNPLPASGGAGAETRDQVRHNAPTAVMALDRLVSERDYTDFTCAFAGIAKASAARLSDGRREVMHVTIAGVDDCPITKNSDLYLNLCRALRRWADPLLPIQISVRRRMVLIIGARVQVLAAYRWETVAPAIQSALLDELSFEKRRLGQPLFQSEVIGIIQDVDGVAYVDVDLLEAVEETESIEDLQHLAENLVEGHPRKWVPVALDHVEWNGPRRVFLPAQLAYLDPELLDTSVFLTEINP